MPPERKRQKTDAHQEKGGNLFKVMSTHDAQAAASDALSKHPSNEISRAAMAAEGWSTTQLPDKMRRCRVPATRRIPSPLVSEVELTDEKMDVINNHAHSSLRLLFRNIRDNAEQFADNALKGHALMNDKHDGHLCALGNSDGKPKIFKWHESSQDRLQISVSVPLKEV